MISMHPEVERKVLAELDAHGLLVTPERPKPRPLEWEDLGRLSYMNNCIKVFPISRSLLCAVAWLRPHDPACCSHCHRTCSQGRWYLLMALKAHVTLPGPVAAWAQGMWLHAGQLAQGRVCCLIRSRCACSPR